MKYPNGKKYVKSNEVKAEKSHRSLLSAALNSELEQWGHFSPVLSHTRASNRSNQARKFY